MPIGVQIVGRHFEEQTVLNASYKLELLSDLRENVYGDHKPTQKNK